VEKRWALTSKPPARGPRKIAATDAPIDRFVRDLDSLTPEVIAIVEGESSDLLPKTP
jgi:hypothetical protein